MSTLLETLLTPQQRHDAEAADIAAQHSNNGRLWLRMDDGSNCHAELWRAIDADVRAHGWAVCLPGDEPEHATWTTTTTERIARAWFAQA